jgi:hypothetical protein
MEDLLGTKLAALLQRVEARDYRDMAAAVRCGHSLGQAIAACMTLYGGTVPAAECLRTVTYFEGSDLRSLTAEERQLLVDAARSVDPEGIPRLPRISPHLHLD